MKPTPLNITKPELYHACIKAIALNLSDKKLPGYTVNHCSTNGGTSILNITSDLDGFEEVFIAGGDDIYWMPWDVEFPTSAPDPDESKVVSVIEEYLTGLNQGWMRVISFYKSENLNERFVRFAIPNVGKVIIVRYYVRPAATLKTRAVFQHALGLFELPFHFESGYILDAKHRMVADQHDGPDSLRVRGWGRIQYIEDVKPEALQDTVGELIADGLTMYWDLLKNVVRLNLATPEDAPKWLRENSGKLFELLAAIPPTKIED